MKDARKSLLLVLAIALIALPVLPASSAPKYTVIRVGTEENFGDISPFGPNSTGRYSMQFILYEPLAKRVKFGCEWQELQLVGAKKITKIDSLTYDVDMYEYITDSAGNPITSADYIWDVEMMGKNKYYPNLTSNLASVTALGPYKVEFKLKNANLGAIEYILDIVPMISKASFEASKDKMTTDIITTSSYVLKSFTAGSGAVLVKNAKYWQTNQSLRSPWAAQNVDEIQFKIISEPAQMSIALETNTIDIAQYPGDAELSRFYDIKSGKAMKGYVATPVLSNTIFHLMPNCSKDSVFSNLKLRQAVFYAIDRDEVMQLATNGIGTTSNAYASRIASDYNPDWDKMDYFAHDTAKAKQLLAEAGYRSGQLRIRLLVPNSGQMYTLAAQAIQAQLADVGINAEINQYDTALYNTTRTDPKQWDLCFVRSGTDDFTTFTWKTNFDRTGNSWGGTRNFITDDQLQKLLETAASLSTHSKKTVNDMEQYLVDNAYGMSLFSTNRVLVANSNVVSSIYFRQSGGLIPGACTFTDAFNR